MSVPGHSSCRGGELRLEPGTLAPPVSSAALRVNEDKKGTVTGKCFSRNGETALRTVVSVTVE